MVYFKKNMTFAIVFLTRDSRKHTSWGHINDEALRINSPPVNCCRCTFRKWTMVNFRHYSAAIWIKQLTFQKISTHSIVLKRWKSHWLVYITASILCTIEARSLYVYPTIPSIHVALMECSPSLKQMLLLLRQNEVNTYCNAG